jgi:hypothetical protein
VELLQQQLLKAQMHNMHQALCPHTQASKSQQPMELLQHRLLHTKIRRGVRFWGKFRGCSLKLLKITKNRKNETPFYFV